ncbi:hypothetical protein CSB93_0822 [Pseudomonas paraeruginosa]|uniref:Uncharacterized protein n=1 Tax=Pseudomonas paraeruginosa TaxID=2994495 RepID=A0A2R3IYS1_9PSED|nr:hypothetical protein CSB93_0822 [Pseudomonas paraeruginosa]AWE91150.1 hypothetical protein CSC28_6137 [Pseudomonas paraeruginosa]
MAAQEGIGGLELGEGRRLRHGFALVGGGIALPAIVAERISNEETATAKICFTVSKRTKPRIIEALSKDSGFCRGYAAAQPSASTAAW